MSTESIQANQIVKRSRAARDALFRIQRRATPSEWVVAVVDAIRVGKRKSEQHLRLGKCNRQAPLPKERPLRIGSEVRDAI